MAKNEMHAPQHFRAESIGLSGSQDLMETGRTHVPLPSEGKPWGDYPEVCKRAKPR